MVIGAHAAEVACVEGAQCGTGGGMEPRSGVTVLIRVRSVSAARGRWGGCPRGSPGGAGL